jgi:hypothetical protein
MCTSPIHGWYARDGTFTTSLKNAWQDRRLSVPCGQCWECRLKKRREWAIRILHETASYDDNCFVTLTYKELPRNGSLKKRDVQLFLKRLRRALEPHKIRYFLTGEYGTQTQRPHYHLIIFNYYPSDAKRHSQSSGSWLYTSEELDRNWQKGRVMVNEVTYDSASYLAKYTCKKLIVSEKSPEWLKAMQESDIREPEFATMSRNGGIGKKFYEKYKDVIYRNDTIIINGKEIKPPSYYDKLAKEDEIDDYFKKRSLRIENFNKRYEKETDLQPFSRNEILESKFKNISIEKI